MQLPFKTASSFAAALVYQKIFVMPTVSLRFLRTVHNLVFDKAANFIIHALPALFVETAMHFISRACQKGGGVQTARRAESASSISSIKLSHSVRGRSLQRHMSRLINAIQIFTLVVSIAAKTGKL